MARRASPKMTAKRRRALPRSKFGLPGKRKYPLDTPGRARNALARASQYATPKQRTQIRKAVARRYPGIKVSGPKAVKRTGGRRRR